MPSGRVHRITTTVAAPLLASAAGWSAATFGQQAGLEDGFRAAVACALGVATTLAVNPDLDLLESSIKSKLRNRPLLAPWWVMWFPYSSSIPHRSPYSHWPLLGTFLRVIYIIFFVSLLAGTLMATNILDPTLVFSSEIPRWFMLWFFFGMASSDALHWLLDVTT